MIFGTYRDTWVGRAAGRGQVNIAKWNKAYASTKSPMQPLVDAWAKHVQGLNDSTHLPRRPPCRRLVAPSIGQDKRLIDTDIMKFVWIAEGQISPTANTWLTRVVIDERRRRRDIAWLAARIMAAPRVLTSGTRDTSPRWSPDSKAIVFVRSPENGKPQPPQIFCWRSTAARRER